MDNERPLNSVEEEKVQHLSPTERQRFMMLQQQRRRLERETVKLFRPQEHQRGVFLSQATELLVPGGNRSGKSVCGGVLVSAAAINQRVYDIDGSQFPMYTPNQLAHDDGRGLVIWCIGAGEAHIGKTFYRLLRKPGLFKIFKNPESGAWETYHPIEHAKWRDLAIKAPPLIPDRMVEEVAWKKKKADFFDMIRLTNGTEIHAFTSGGDVKMGDPVDLIWIDERIKYEQYYPEWQARLSDYDGRILWTLYPGNINVKVRNVYQRSLACKMDPEPEVETVRLEYSKNSFFSDAVKAKRIGSWDETERAQRDRGDFFFGAARMYPHFEPDFHRTPCHNPEEDDAIDAAIRDARGIPSDWCYSLIIDPGTTHPGILLMATAPPRLWKNLGGRVDVVAGESYLPNSDAGEQIRKALPMLKGISLQRMIIDFRAGRSRGMGRGLKNKDHYERELRDHQVRCEDSDHNLIYASDELLGGLQAVRLALKPRSNGRPGLRYLNTLNHFPEQMETYIKGQNAAGHIVDEPASGQVDCLCDCIRYFCVGEYPYEAPPVGKQSNMTPFDVWERFFKPKSKKKGVYCGAGSAD